MTDNIFEKGTRLNVRFEHKGSIGLEELWDLSSEELNSIYVKLVSSLKSKEVGLLKTKKKEDEILDLKVKIVEHIFEVKEEEETKRIEKSNNRKQVEFYDKIIEQKQNQAVLDLPIEKIIEMRNSLK